MKKEIKVKITYTPGWQERFTKACVQVASRRAQKCGA